MSKIAGFSMVLFSTIMIIGNIFNAKYMANHSRGAGYYTYEVKSKSNLGPRKRIPLEQSMVIPGIFLIAGILLLKYGKSEGPTDNRICPECEVAFDAKTLKCSSCDIETVPLHGFYDRQKEKTDQT